jgi:hypothetical protein
MLGGGRTGSVVCIFGAVAKGLSLAVGFVLGESVCGQFWTGLDGHGERHVSEPFPSSPECWVCDRRAGWSRPL